MNERRRLAARLAPAALLLALVLAILAPAQSWLDLAGDPTRGQVFESKVDELAEDGTRAVVGFDPDLGTYPEIRATVRAVLTDLLDRGASLEFVSFTAEGRALAVAEIERLRELPGGGIVDLGFAPGAEAALAEASRDVFRGGGETGRVDLAVVIGGSDIGPRSWVEQVRPRVPELDIIALTPTVLLPEVAPYLASGQIAALLGTVGDGAAYRDLVRTDSAASGVEPERISPLALLVGMVSAIAVLAAALLRRTDVPRAAPPGRATG